MKISKRRHPTSKKYISNNIKYKKIKTTTKENMTKNKKKYSHDYYIMNMRIIILLYCVCVCGYVIFCYYKY